MIKYRGQLRGSHELFHITLFFHFMIDVLNLKLCFATDVLTERGQVRYPSLAPFFHSDLNLLMEFLYFTG